jgi:uncharacterized protein YraI
MKTPPCLCLWLGAPLLALSAAAGAQNAITAGPADLRAGPDPTYPVVARLDADTPVQVLGCLDDWSWCDVSLEDTRGWLYAPAITYDYEGGYVPLYSYAPALGIPVVTFSLDDYWGRYYHERPWYAERDDWRHRAPRHERPAGPPPSTALPPHPLRSDRPERSVHLGDAEPPRPEAGPPPAPRHEEHSNAVERASPARPEQREAPPPRQERAHPERATPPQHDERPPVPQRMEGPRHEEKENRGDHPGDNHP